MRTTLLPHAAFLLRRTWRTDPCLFVIVTALTAVSGASILSALSAYASLAQSSQAVAAIRASQGRQANAVLTSKPIELTTFRSVEFPDALNDAAEALALPVEATVFRLDEKVSQPYVRYTATMNVSGGYLAIRRFVQSVRKPLPQSSLDAIVCTRANIRAVPLTCQITLSIFYRSNFS